MRDCCGFNAGSGVGVWDMTSWKTMIKGTTTRREPTEQMTEPCNCDQALEQLKLIGELRVQLEHLSGQRDRLQIRNTELLTRARQAEASRCTLELRDNTNYEVICGLQQDLEKAGATIARYKRMFADKSGRWDSDIDTHSDTTTTPNTNPTPTPSPKAT